MRWLNFFSKKKQNKSYHQSLEKHYIDFFGVKGRRKKAENATEDKYFYFLEFDLRNSRNMWAYCTVGLSTTKNESSATELVLYSPKKDESLFEFLALHVEKHLASSIELNQIIEIEKPWLDKSKCMYTFISLPYLDGEKLELFNFENKLYHCYWLIPITSKEKQFKVVKGTEALEELFEFGELNYLDPHRECFVEKFIT